MYNNIPYKNIDGKKFVDFENLNYSPTKENAETFISIMIIHPYQLTKKNVKDFFKLIKQVYKLYPDFQIRFFEWLKVKKMLDTYGFKYDRKFVNDKIVSNLNYVYQALKNGKENLLTSEEEIYLEFLESFKENADGNVEKILKKLDYFCEKEK